jgi:HD superfamily phosphohydrolase
MEFLRLDLRPKVLRTRLYGDQEFSRFELELLHTPLLQRLYNLKQLGFTDRVYPDAIHSRFNHILGVAELTEKMARRLASWLRAHKGEPFTYSGAESNAKVESNQPTVTGEALAAMLEFRVRSLRLMGLLHDLTHAAFGHTLEDEVSVFNEKHDNPARQARFFDALVAQLLYLWSTEERLHTFDPNVIEELSRLNVSPDRKRETRLAEELAELLSAEDRCVLAQLLRELELAFRLLLRIEFIHQSTAAVDRQPSLLVSDVASIIESSVPAIEFVLHRDMFMVDLVGNTICADLLDYARRDADNAGLRVQFDDRLLRYLCVVSVRGDLSPTGKPCIRSAIQIFTDKMRYDVLSEMSGILKARYLINERAVFHPTKCAAGAMLGTAIQLLAFRELPRWMQVLGDQEFLRELVVIAGNLESLCTRVEDDLMRAKQPPWRDVVRGLWPADPDMANAIQEIVSSTISSTKPSENMTSAETETLLSRASAARSVLWRLISRRFPKLAYRLRVAHHTGGASDETIAGKYCRPEDRYALERRVEEVCKLPVGSLFVHCPKRKTSLKAAEVLVVGANLCEAARLRNVTKVSPEGLEPYEREIVAIEDMYRSIWQFHAYLDLAHWDKQPVVEWALERELGFPNDQLLVQELAHERTGPYYLLAGELRDEIPPKLLPKVIEQVDSELTARLREVGGGQDMRDKLLAIIREVLSEAGGNNSSQLGLPGIGQK